MNKSILIILCLICIGLTQCKTSSKVASPTIASPTSDVSTTPIPNPGADIATGETIFNAKCGDCHKLPLPDEYTQSEWVGIMPKMARKSNLNPTEAHQVLAFINKSARP